VTNTQQAMMDLDMEIIGDPYYIVQSGQGNYTASSTQYTNLTDDGSMNYQNGEVDIIINFRTPIDINQSSGLYNFGGSTSALVTQWSGLYAVTDIISTFRDGQFKQTLKGQRRPLQELLEEAGVADTYGTTQEAQPAAEDVATEEE
jgi:GH15 family glucan-1,4-alpha-glucosidase